jgi:hypothetical protein
MKQEFKDKAEAMIDAYKELLNVKIDAIMEALRKFKFKFYHKKLELRLKKDLKLKSTKD